MFSINEQEPQKHIETRDNQQLLLPIFKKLKPKMTTTTAAATTLNSFLPTNPKKPCTSIIPTNYPTRSFTNSKLPGHLLPCPVIRAVTEDKQLLPTDQDDENEPSLPLEMESTNNVASSTSTTVDRALNAAIVLGAGTLAVTKLLTIDQEYWHVCVKIAFLFDTCSFLAY